jgi:hypothetical protein
MKLNLIKVKTGKARYKPTKISLSAFNKRVKSGNMKHDYNEYYKSGGKTYKRTYAHNPKRNVLSRLIHKRVRR